MSFKDARKKVVIVDEATKATFPVLQWINGKPALKSAGKDSISYTGGFFIKAESVPADFEPPAGFTTTEMLFSNNKSEIGYAAQMADVAVIRIRKCWVYENGAKEFLPWNEYKPGAKSLVQVLVGLKGCNVPMVLSMGGKARSEMLRGVLEFIDGKLLKKANEGVGKNEVKLPRLAFYVRLTSQAKLDQTKGFVKVGTGAESSIVTPMVAHVPPEVDEAYLNAKYVGDEAFEMYQQWYVDAQSWADEWNTRQAAPHTPTTAEDSPAAPAAEDIPF